MVDFSEDLDLCQQVDSLVSRCAFTTGTELEQWLAAKTVEGWLEKRRLPLDSTWVKDHLSILQPLGGREQGLYEALKLVVDVCLGSRAANGVRAAHGVEGVEGAKGGVEGAEGDGEGVAGAEEEVEGGVECDS